MNAQAFSRTGYGRPEIPIRSNRQIEYDLFARVTGRLTQANRDRDGDFPAFARALQENLELWQTLASDVALPGNGLPQQLRARLYYLYQFTAQHTRKILGGNAEIGVLIDINTAVMRGLRGEGDPA